MEKVSSACHLQLIQLASELQVDHGLGVRRTNLLRITPGVVQVLPRGEGGTHGATNQQQRLYVTINLFD